MDKKAGLTDSRDLDKLHILAEKSAKLWGLSVSKQIKLLGKSENLVYEIDDYILRITESHHRTANEIKAELDFIDLLSNANISVSAPQKSSTGRFIETIDDYHICVFEKANGTAKTVEEAFKSTKTAYNLGKEIGKIHNLTINYNLITNKRHSFEDDIHYKNGLDFIPANDKIAVQEFKKASEWVKTIPQEKSNFGLIHMDAHAGNFFVDANDKITLFDFDDCAYHFFTYDLAVPLNHLEASQLSSEQKQKARTAFLDGYAEEYKLPKESLDMIDGFIRFRTIEIYAWRCMMFGEPKADGKVLNFVSFYKSKTDFTKPFPSYKINNSVIHSKG